MLSRDENVAGTLRWVYRTGSRLLSTRTISLISNATALRLFSLLFAFALLFPLVHFYPLSKPIPHIMLTANQGGAIKAIRIARAILSTNLPFFSHLFLPCLFLSYGYPVRATRSRIAEKL
jgi:hypothetical protein